MLDMAGQWARRLWPLVIVGGLLAGVAVLSMLGNTGVHLLPPLPVASTAIVLPSASPSSDAAQSPTRTAGTAHRAKILPNSIEYGSLVVVALVILAWLVWYLPAILSGRRGSRRNAVFGDASAVNRRAAVLAAVDDSIAELARDSGDARDVVIACWVRLEEVAAVAGSGRAIGDTSSDLVLRLLSDHQITASVLLSLADLYRTARYSTQSIESSMREQARAALGRLRDELSRSRSGPLADEPVATDSVPSMRRPSPRSTEVPR
jgi:uncharacterized protein DUF4129